MQFIVNVFLNHIYFLLNFHYLKFAFCIQSWCISFFIVFVRLYCHDFMKALNIKTQTFNMLLCVISAFRHKTSPTSLKVEGKTRHAAKVFALSAISEPSHVQFTFIFVTLLRFAKQLKFAKNRRRSLDAWFDDLLCVFLAVWALPMSKQLLKNLFLFYL